MKRIGRQDVRVSGAGRTDSGVHALGQVAHFDWENPLPPARLILGMNALLPIDIRLLSLEPVQPEFHSRFDAISKIYLYRIDRSLIYNPFTYRYAWHYRRPLYMDLVYGCGRRSASPDTPLAVHAPWHLRRS